MEAITVSLKHYKWCFSFFEIIQELRPFTSYNITCQICVIISTFSFTSLISGTLQLSVIIIPFSESFFGYFIRIIRKMHHPFIMHYFFSVLSIIRPHKTTCFIIISCLEVISYLGHSIIKIFIDCLVLTLNTKPWCPICSLLIHTKGDCNAHWGISIWCHSTCRCCLIYLHRHLAALYTK